MTIEWNDAGNEGTTRDGRIVKIEASVLTGRFVAVIPVGNGAETRRSRVGIEETRRAVHDFLGQEDGIKKG